MPAFVQYLTAINPLRYAIDITRRVYLEGTGLEMLISDLWPLALMASLTLTAPPGCSVTDAMTAVSTRTAMPETPAEHRLDGGAFLACTVGRLRAAQTQTPSIGRPRGSREAAQLAAWWMSFKIRSSAPDRARARRQSGPARRVLRVEEARHSARSQRQATGLPYPPTRPTAGNG